MTSGENGTKRTEVIKKNIFSGSWGDVAVVKSIDCSRRGARLGFKRPHWVAHHSSSKEYVTFIWTLLTPGFIDVDLQYRHTKLKNGTKSLKSVFNTSWEEQKVACLKQNLFFWNCYISSEGWEWKEVVVIINIWIVNFQYLMSFVPWHICMMYLFKWSFKEQHCEKWLK